MSSTRPLIHLSDVKKVFYTDEVETHALSGIHAPQKLRRDHASDDNDISAGEVDVDDIAAGQSEGELTGNNGLRHSAASRNVNRIYV